MRWHFTPTLTALAALLPAQRESPHEQPPLRAVQAAALSPSPTTGIAVEVRSEKGRPVANALVGVLPANWSPEQTTVVAELTAAHRDDPNQALAAVLLRFGTRYRCDDAGRTIVPATARRVVACSGVLAGETVVPDPAAAPAVVHLLGPRTVFVRVVGPEGKPVAGLPVGFGIKPFHESNVATTDSRGECVVGGRWREDQAAWIAPRVAGDPTEHELPAGTPWPRMPVEIRMPPTGLLRVLAYDQGEQPRLDVEAVQVSLAGGRAGVLQRGEGNGAIVRVALGQEFLVRVQMRGTTGWIDANCTGPTRPGELVICDVRATQGPPVLVFRVLDQTGAPVLSRDLFAVLVHAESSRGAGLPVDATGTARVTLSHRNEDLEVFVVRRAPPRDDRGIRYLGAARFAVPAVLKPGDNPLPDVILGEEPVVVAGVVVDDEGKPLPGARVQAKPGWERETHGFSGSLGHTVETDADGRFEVRDLAATDTVKLIAILRESGHARVDVQFAKGTTDARIVLVREGRVRLVLDGLPKTPHNLLFASLVAAGERPNGTSIEGDTWLRRPAGRYDLVVSLRRDDHEIARIPDVVVTRGADTEDARLLPFAWREHVKPITITVVDEAGAPVPGRMVWCLYQKPGGGESGGGGATDAAGMFATLVPPEGAKLRIENLNRGDARDRYRAVELTKVTTDRRVVLRPKLQVVVQLQGDWSLPAGTEVTWGAGQEPGPAVPRPRTGPASATGKLEWQFDAPGTYEVRMTAMIPGEGNRTMAKPIVWGTIDVVEQRDVQHFPLQLTDDEQRRLDDLREQLKK